MPDPLATVVVVPRERFGVTRRSLEAIYANTTGLFQLVYVDGGSPARIRRYLADEARARGFTLLRTDRYLTPNEARNLGVPHARTRYIVFIDNDVVPAPGWLDKLVECAETTGAWIVGPMYFIGEPRLEEIHMAGGDARIEEGPTGRRFLERHRFAGKHPADVRAHLMRMPCEQVEFHCMLVRAEVFERLGPLDEALRSVAEHSDFCMLVRRGGGEVYFEPDSVVTYITSGRYSWSDQAFFFWRWSDAWTEASVERFSEKWDLPLGDAGTKSLSRWAEEHRQRHIPLTPTLRALERVFGWRLGRWFGHDVLLAIERRFNRWWVPPPQRVPREAASPGPVRAGRRPAMFPYAQTNLQLYRQLAAEGFAATEIRTVAAAYELGLRLFPGTYRGSGKPFLAHLVGTASVLASLRARTPVVVTGLLHAVYTHGEFGNGWPGMSDRKRKEIRRAVGEETEDLIACYTRLRWQRRTIPEIRARLDTMTPADRDVLLVRLANELEDHLDLGILYLADVERRREFMRADLPAAAEMAKQLGFPALSRSLTETFAEVAGVEIVPGLRRGNTESFRIPFASHRPRLRVVLSHLLARRPWR